MNKPAAKPPPAGICCPNTVNAYTPSPTSLVMSNHRHPISIVPHEPQRQPQRTSISNLVVDKLDVVRVQLPVIVEIQRFLQQINQMINPFIHEVIIVPQHLFEF
jgi:hypothetical protein